jgi:hypothetical protein
MIGTEHNRPHRRAVRPARYSKSRRARIKLADYISRHKRAARVGWCVDFYVHGKRNEHYTIFSKVEIEYGELDDKFPIVIDYQRIVVCQSKDLHSTATSTRFAWHDRDLLLEPVLPRPSQQALVIRCERPQLLS